MQKHIPKRHLDFENPIVNNNAVEDTKGRIYGETIVNDFATETGKIGTAFNPVDNLPKHGKKTLTAEQEVSIVTLIE